MRINIAIDGPSASGKSTIAKLLAKRLGYTHIDTGAMYRSVAYWAKKHKIEMNEESLARMLETMHIVLTPSGDVFVNDEDVTRAIRSNEMSLGASQVSVFPEVRKRLVEMQREMAKDKGFIMDGRDIGTVVLPEAEVKIFQTASADSRALRRYNENISKGILSDFDTLKKEIEDRDYQDTHRKASPLLKAADAVEIDTSDMGIDDVVNAVIEYIEERMKNHD
ncbi:MAG TPA: (d)CMP kinase [Erysipelotrichaceae bacterium]|nr:(d)CMP kinase [Erysipelotrichaceae bacterium]